MRGRTSRMGLVVLMAGGAVLMAGCVTNYFARIGRLPTRARIGVILTDSDGRALEPTVAKSYVYDSLMRNRMVPVALNDAKVRMTIIARIKEVEFKEGSGIPPALKKLVRDPKMLLSLEQYFKKKEIDYVMIVYVDTKAFDEDIRAVLVRVKDMVVIGTRFYRYRIMLPLFLALTPVTCGLNLIVLPMLYLRDPHKPNYRLVDDFIQRMKQ